MQVYPSALHFQLLLSLQGLNQVRAVLTTPWPIHCARGFRIRVQPQCTLTCWTWDPCCADHPMAYRLRSWFPYSCANTMRPHLLNMGSVLC